MPRRSPAEADPADQFQNALHYWRHPSGPLPPAMTAVLKKQARPPSRNFFLQFSFFPEVRRRARVTKFTLRPQPATSGAAPTRDAVWFQARVSEWARAFESLFALLRVGLCPYFYYVGEDFHVLFRAAVAGAGAADQPVTALLSNSSRGLRRRLQDQVIGFTLPYGMETEQTEEQLRWVSSRLPFCLTTVYFPSLCNTTWKCMKRHDCRCLEELRRLRSERGGDEEGVRVRETARIGFTDGGPDSLLLLRGRNDVAGLFNFLKDLYRCVCVYACVYVCVYMPLASQQAPDLTLEIMPLTKAVD